MSAQFGSELAALSSATCQQRLLFLRLLPVLLDRGASLSNPVHLAASQAFLDDSRTQGDRPWPALMRAFAGLLGGSKLTRKRLMSAARPDGRRVRYLWNENDLRYWEDKAQPVAYIVSLFAPIRYEHHSEDRMVEVYDRYGYIQQPNPHVS